MQLLPRKDYIGGDEIMFVKLPRYTEKEIKKIEKEFEGEKGWVSADEVLGKDRKVESVFVFEVPERAKRKTKRK